MQCVGVACGVGVCGRGMGVACGMGVWGRGMGVCCIGTCCCEAVWECIVIYMVIWYISCGNLV